MTAISSARQFFRLPQKVCGAFFGFGIAHSDGAVECRLDLRRQAALAGATEGGAHALRLPAVRADGGVQVVDERGVVLRGLCAHAASMS